MVWQLLVLKLEGLQRAPHTSGNKGLEFVDWDLCDKEVYNNLGGVGGRNEPGTDLSGGKQEMRFKEVGVTSAGKAIDLVITNTTEYVPNPWTPKAARAADANATIGGQYFNGRKECVGVFNIDSPSTVTLKFSMVLAGTDKLAPAGIYDFSILDWDKSEMGVVEEIVVEGIENWTYIGDVKPVTLDDKGDKLMFSSKGSARPATGNEVTNPSAPDDLTDAQKKASVAFVYKASEWEITFKAIDYGTREPGPGHPGGRNFIFAGRSPLVPPTVAPAPTPAPSPCYPANVTFDWDLCSSKVYNNLGGLGGGKEGGKGSELPKELRYERVATADTGEVLDLVITNTTEYVPNPDPPKAVRAADGNATIGGQYFNGRKGCMGVFNIMSPSEVTLKFSFVLSGKDLPAPADIFPSFPLTIYDFDQANKSGIREQMKVRKRNVKLTPIEVGHEEPIEDASSYTFMAHEENKEIPNPWDPYKLTAAQKNASVGLVYSVNTWEITFSAVDTSGGGVRKGRNFMFAGRSNKHDPCIPNATRPKLSAPPW